MAKKKQIVGTKNIVRTAIPCALDKLILEFKLELEVKTGGKVSKQWAALQFARDYQKIKNGNKK
jgi:hypothetical protein